MTLEENQKMLRLEAENMRLKRLVTQVHHSVWDDEQRPVKPSDKRGEIYHKATQILKTKIYLSENLKYLRT